MQPIVIQLVLLIDELKGEKLQGGISPRNLPSFRPQKLLSVNSEKNGGNFLTKVNFLFSGLSFFIASNGGSERVDGVEVGGLRG
jgi:hypothetical protein